MKRWITLSAICTLLVLIVGLGYVGTSQGAEAATVAASQGPDPTPPTDGGGYGYPDLYARCYDPGRIFCCYDVHWNVVHCRCTYDYNVDGYRWRPY